MPDWKYQNYSGVPEGLLEAKVNQPSKYASGLNALLGSLSPGMQQAISTMVQNGQLQKIISSMNQQQQPSFPQGQQPQAQGQGQAQQGTPGSAMPNPFQQSVQKNTGMYNSPLSMGGNDPLGLFS